MRWTKAGVENLLQLRAVVENGDWAAYQRFHQAQRYQRLYGVPERVPALTESQILADEDLLTTPLPAQRLFHYADHRAPTLTAAAETRRLNEAN